MITICCDGASRNNPGKSGIGVIISKKGEKISEISEYLGEYSNNFSEYCAVLRALIEINELILKDDSFFDGCDKILIALDSQLVVKQMNKEYQIKNKDLKKIYDFINEYISKISIDVQFIWIPRSENSVADNLANLGIDKEIQLHPKLVECINSKNTSKSTIEKNQNLKLERVFFSKTSCLKYQLSQSKEVYVHIGKLNNSSWDWKIVKFNDLELCEILDVLENKKEKCAFYHNNTHSKSDKSSTQIWCAQSSKGFTMKIQDSSKLLNLNESRVLKILIERSIWEISLI